MRPLVITRPQPRASATAEAARRLGLEPVLLPLFELVPVNWKAPDPAAFDALLLTSANAARMGGGQLERLRSLPAHCVGEATADAARQAGFEIASVGDGGVEALLSALPPGLRLFHLSGADRRAPRQPRQRIETVPTYAAKPLPTAQLSGIDGSVVTLYSPRASARFAELATEANLDRSSVAIAAISGEAAAAAGSGWERIEAAAEPADAALLSLAARLCNNRN